MVRHHMYDRYKRLELDSGKSIERLKEELTDIEMNDKKESIDQKVKEYSELVYLEHWYFYMSLNHDIALLKVEQPIVPVFNETHYIVNSICLPKSGHFNDKTESAIFIGMG